MLSRFFTRRLIWLMLLEVTSGWGILGHRTVGYLARMYMTPSTAAYVDDLLGGEDISDAAVWADIYKETPAGEHTVGWHFVNAHDSPPTLCNVLFTRDCGAARNCIISAIANSSARLVDRDVSHQSRYEALKFVLHLVGDVHQPFHVEGSFRGGNDVTVYFEGRKTNLHFVWDVEIPHKYTKNESATEKEIASRWADHLFKTYQNSTLKALSKTRKGCLSREEPVLCAENWAREANQLLCDYCLMSASNITGRELSGPYYDLVIPLVNMMINKAARRIADAIHDLVSQSAGQLGNTDEVEFVYSKARESQDEL